jgi:hypothetical protein
VVSPGGRLFDDADLIVELAERAPSPMGSQPWQLHARDGGIDLALDRAKVTDHGPVSHRQGVIACGAALLNMRITLGHLGLEPRVTTFPDATRPDLVARVEASTSRAPLAEEDRLITAMLRRRMRRELFLVGTVPAFALEQLGEAVSAEGAQLLQMRGIRAAELDILLAETDTTATSDPATAAGLRAAWAPDGNRGSVAVLCTTRDEPADWLCAGQALQRMLLEASSRDVDARMFTLALEDDAHRDQIRRQACAGRWPQIVLELGRDGWISPEAPTRQARRTHG